MGQRLVNIEKLYAFGFVIKFDGLPTRDLSKEGGSGKAAQHHHRIAPLGKVADANRFAHIIEDSQIRQAFANLGAIDKPRVLPSRPLLRKRSKSFGS